MNAHAELDADTRARAEEFWAERLGCAVSALRAPGRTFVARADPSVFIVATARGVVVTAPPALQAALEALAEPRALVAWDTLAPLLPPSARTVGAAWIGYTNAPAGSSAGVEAVPSTRELAALRAAVREEEWRHANLESAESPLFACSESGAPVAASGYQLLLDRVAHIGVVTHPAWRGRGAGRRCVAAALGAALERKRLPQYQTLMANAPARRIADALGFAHFATTLGARW